MVKQTRKKARFFLLVKRKTAKAFSLVIPGRRGVSKDQLRKAARKDLRGGFTFRVINTSQLKTFLRNRAEIKNRVKRKTTVKSRRIKRRKK